jgi:hypothetical protein
MFYEKKMGEVIESSNNKKKKEKRNIDNINETETLETEQNE